MTSEERQQRALQWLAAAAVAAIVWISAPVAVGILLGTLLAFTLQPLYERISARVGRNGAAVVTVVGTAIALLSFVAALGRLLFVQGGALVRELVVALQPGGPAAGVVAAAGRVTSRLGVDPQELMTQARAGIEEIATRVAATAESVAEGTAGGLLGLFFAMLSLDYILRNWAEMSSRAQQVLPLRPTHTAALFDEFQRVGRNTLAGTIVTGLGQGLLATIGYAITGVPKPLFFGALTALASLLPAVGTLLVWVPIGAALILLGHPARGILELAWGAVVVIGVSDYVIRPHLVGGEGDVPALFTFVALLGGAETFGLKGLIVGPVVMSLAVAVLRLYAAERAAPPAG